MPEKTTPSDDVIKDALERFVESVEGSEFNRRAYYEDTKFARMADQWPDTIKKLRVQEGRPVLVINKLPALIRAIVNESRQNKPAMKVAPVDNGADEDTAEVIGGLLRSIERNSNSEVAYDTAIDHAVTGGFGFFRIVIDYAHDETFDLECMIKRVPNALMVHWDTSSTEFDASDWEHAFISEMIGREVYEKRYPEGSTVSFDGDSRNDSSDQWISEDGIRIGEYFLRVEKTRQLLLLEVPNQQTGQMDMQMVREADLPAMAKKAFEAGGIDSSGGSDEQLAQAFMEMSGVTEKNRREVVYHEVIRRIINGVEVLEEEEWPGSTIPICPVWGDEVFIDGRRNFRSMIRDAKDSQAMFNFWRSATTELVALAPKAPWIGAKGFVPKGDKEKWASANTRSHAYLEYDPVANAPPPARTSFAGVPAGALQEAMNANDDMKAITGIFDSSLGARSNETSGKAILARERQGDVSNFHFIDNLSRAIRYAGQVLVEIIPSVYSARETIRILGEDQAQKVVKLTQEAGGGREKGPGGKPELYNLTVGKYDVTVSTGPSFSTQREETRETLIEIMRQVPDSAAFLGDVLLDHMDFVGADKVAKRLKMLLPAEVREAEDAEGAEDNPEAAALKGQLQQMGQQAEQWKKAAMDEIGKIQAENEQLKADKSVEAQKAQAEAGFRSRELALKEKESNKPEPDQTQKQDHDRAMAHDKMDFEAGENARDRITELAKVILSKIEDDDSEEDAAGAIVKAVTDAEGMLQ